MTLIFTASPNSSKASLDFNMSNFFKFNHISYTQFSLFQNGYKFQIAACQPIKMCIVLYCLTKEQRLRPLKSKLYLVKIFKNVFNYYQKHQLLFYRTQIAEKVTLGSGKTLPFRLKLGKQQYLFRFILQTYYLRNEVSAESSVFDAIVNRVGGSYAV